MAGSKRKAEEMNGGSRWSERKVQPGSDNARQIASVRQQWAHLDEEERALRAEVEVLEASLTEMGFREDEIVAYLTKLKVPSQPVTTMELALRPREAEDEEPREDDGSTRSLSCREMFVDSADMSCSKQGCQYSHEFSFHLRHWGPFRKKMKAGTLSPQVQVLVDAEEKAWEARKAARGSQKPTNDGGMDTT